MNKQEVIEIIYDELRKSSHPDDADARRERAEALYVRIAREFPEEAAKQLYLDRNILSHDGFMARIKHLLEDGAVREFPEEAVEKIIMDLYEVTYASGVKKTPLILDPNVSAVEDIKRLWEGTEQGFINRNAIGDVCCLLKSPCAFHKSKSGCPTCGGSGEVPCGLVHPNPNWRVGHDIPCSDCGGTGERRKGKRREGLVERRQIY